MIKFLKQEEREILEILNREGKGYIVGGYIRDILLGLTPKDCDFATNIDYSKLKEIFSEYSPIEIGKNFGIIQIRYGDRRYEIAKFRKEMAFSKLRNQVEIEFIDKIEEDLQRRDFTINGIAFDGKKVIFPSQITKYDIKYRVLRFIGDGNRRIEEDPLRVLRGIRIAGLKRLKIAKTTEIQMKQGVIKLKRVSIERIQDEIFKIMSTNDIGYALNYLLELNVIKIFFPITLQNNDIKEIFNNLKRIKKLENNELFIQRMAILFQNSKEELEIFKLSKAQKKSIIDIIENFNMIENKTSSYQLKQLVFNIGLDGVKRLINLKRLSQIKKKLREILNRDEVIFLKELDINGEDIKKEFNIERKEIGSYLLKALDFVWRHPKLNNRDNLIKFLKKERD